MHKSAGIIIVNDKSEFLLINRANKPFGWTCPSGHIEEGETPEQAIRRETLDKTGLVLKKCQFIFTEFVEWDECSSGERGHNWYLFEAIDWEGELKLNAEEAKEIKWVLLDEVKKIELQKIWQFWLSKLGLIE